MNLPPLPQCFPRGRRFSGASLGLLLLVAGCQSLPPLPAADVTQPGWTVRQGQAVWRPKTGATEMIGDVWIGTRGAEESFVQFSKTPFPVAAARRIPGQWQIHFALGNRTARGKAAPPAKYLWLFVADALLQRPLPGGVEAAAGAPGQWHLKNSATGEELLLAIEP